jgi:hypothetical protein
VEQQQEQRFMTKFIMLGKIIGIPLNCQEKKLVGRTIEVDFVKFQATDTSGHATTIAKPKLMT